MAAVNELYCIIEENFLGYFHMSQIVCFIFCIFAGIFLLIV